jgi:hypothetical protein
MFDEYPAARVTRLEREMFSEDLNNGKKYVCTAFAASGLGRMPVVLFCCTAVYFPRARGGGGSAPLPSKRYDWSQQTSSMRVRMRR